MQSSVLQLHGKEVPVLWIFQTSHTALYLAVGKHTLKSVLFICNVVNEQKLCNKYK